MSLRVSIELDDFGIRHEITRYTDYWKGSTTEAVDDLLREARSSFYASMHVIPVELNETVKELA